MTRMMRTAPKERRAMGERARCMVVERFSLEKVLDGWEELYEELLRDNQNASRWALATSRG
jgi:glycosyltransferase involved in cell wall biosynthesis